MIEIKLEIFQPWARPGNHRAGFDGLLCWATRRILSLVSNK